MSSRRPSRALLWLAMSAPPAAVALAASTGSVRGEIGVANIALALAALSVLAAIVHWGAGAVTSLAAALSLVYFHTEPVRSFRVTSPADVTTVLALLAIGLGTSAVTAWRVRQRVTKNGYIASREGAERVRSSALSARPAVELWRDSMTATAASLTLLSARLEKPARADVPRIARRDQGGLDDDDVVVPPTGAAMQFEDPRLDLELVLTPLDNMGPVRVGRQVLLAFARDLELALACGTLEP